MEYPILKDKDFQEFIRQKYEITYGNIMGEDPVLEEETENA